jgi:hypothetical protein
VTQEIVAEAASLTMGPMSRTHPARDFSRFPCPVASTGDRPGVGGSCRFGKGEVCVGDPVKSVPEPGTGRAIVDCAAHLEQQISAIS